VLDLFEEQPETVDAMKIMITTKLISGDILDIEIVEGGERAQGTNAVS